MVDADVIIAGGSIAGLLCAREAAAGGASVIVFEEDSEIGTPEHCGGLVSTGGIRDMGIIPDSRIVQNNKITKAQIKSPSKSFEINADYQKVMVVDRRGLDKQVAHQAQRNGAELRVRSSVKSVDRHDRTYTVKTADGDFACDFLVDARGVSTLIKKRREGVLQSAQYEVYAPWINEDTIEVFFDSVRFPGFFAWVIPTGNGSGKIGVAGRGINAAETLHSYISDKGKCSIVRKVYAPISVGGPLAEFSEDRTLFVGDAAGQSKPTTAGGIFTCGLGGIYAGAAIGRAISSGSIEPLQEYDRNWFGKFKAEFDKMLLARKMLERLDNKALDEIVSAVPAERIEEASRTGDFDFHSSAITKILSSKSAIKFAKALLGNEIRRLFDPKQDINFLSGP